MTNAFGLIHEILRWRYGGITGSMFSERVTEVCMDGTFFIKVRCGKYEQRGGFLLRQFELLQSADCL